MSLKDLYIEKCKAAEATVATTDSGFLFAFSENFPTLWTVEDGFKTYQKLCAMTADEFNRYVEDSPAQARRFMDNMRRTKLFMTRGGKKVLSAKGEVFEKCLLERLSPDDRWFIDYLFICDGYYNLESNHLFAETDRIFDCWLKSGYTLAQIYNSLIYLFNIRQGNMEEYLQTEYVIMTTFRNDPVFLNAYRTANEFEKSELHDYILDNYTKERYACIVSKRFAPSALIDCDTILDDAKKLFFTHYIKNSHPISLEDMIEIFVQVYTRFYKLNARKINNFIMMYEDVFRMTFLNLFSDNNELPLTEAVGVSSAAVTEVNALDTFDYTTTESFDDLNRVNAVLSSAARDETEFRCELEKENKCRYFTSKTTGKPYLEIHQLIPRDFANEFSTSLERASNYVPLCPHCHRLIHEATDAERMQLLATVYRKRKEWLAEDGLEPSNDLLLAVYGITQDKLASQSDSIKHFLNAPQPKLGVGKRGLRLKEKQERIEQGEGTGAPIIVGAAVENSEEKPKKPAALKKAGKPAAKGKTSAKKKNS